MPGRLPRPRLLARAVPLAVVTACVCVAWGGTPAATSVYSRTDSGGRAGGAADAAAAAPARAAQAERIVASAIARLANAHSVSARLRQKARVGSRVLVGTGRYVQSGRGEDQRYRFESTLTCDPETFETIEVCDGVFAWSFRHFGGDPPHLERLDVRRVRDKLHALKIRDPETVAPYVGGLQRVLGLVREQFQFITAQAGVIDGVAVWVVDGRWNPAWIKAFLPDLAAAADRPDGIAAAELPEHVPWAVRLSIGQSDLALYRIEWLAVPGPRPVTAGEAEPVAVLEFQDMKFGGPVDAGLFVYRPAGAGLIDLTETHVAGLTPLRP